MSTFPTPILIFKRYAVPNKDGTFSARLELRRDYGYKVDKLSDVEDDKDFPTEKEALEYGTDLAYATRQSRFPGEKYKVE